MRFNTGIAAMMEFVNAANKVRLVSGAVRVAFVWPIARSSLGPLRLSLTLFDSL